MFQPLQVPNGPGLRRWLSQTVAEIADAMRKPRPQFVQLDVLETAPDKPQDGTLVYADGTSWDPGSGAGIYARECGAWVKL
jgi:hypothetical protein